MPTTLYSSHQIHARTVQRGDVITDPPLHRKVKRVATYGETGAVKTTVYFDDDDAPISVTWPSYRTVVVARPATPLPAADPVDTFLTALHTALHAASDQHEDEADVAASDETRTFSYVFDSRDSPQPPLHVMKSQSLVWYETACGIRLSRRLTEYRGGKGTDEWPKMRGCSDCASVHPDAYPETQKQPSATETRERVKRIIEVYSTHANLQSAISSINAAEFDLQQSGQLFASGQAGKAKALLVDIAEGLAEALVRMGLSSGV